MPAPPSDDDYSRMLFHAVQDLATQLGALRVEVKEEVAQQLRHYREDSHRAIMGIYTRLVSLEDTIETDRGARLVRQQQLDGELHGIRNNQRWWLRGIVLVVLVAVGIGIGIWFF